MPMFHRHDPQDSQDHFQENNTPHYYQNAASYRSYEEVLAQKRRRARLRRGCAVCAILVAVGGAGGYLLLRSDPNEVPSESAEADPSSENGLTAIWGGNDSQETDSAQSSDDSAFSMEIRKKPENSDGGFVVKDVSDVVQKVRPSVVGVITESFQTYSTSSTGSGIILSEDGYIVTNNHVVEGGDSIAVTLDDGETYAAELIGTDVKSDIAVLKIDAQDLPAAEFGDSSQVEVGEAAIAIGNPLGLNGTVTAGIISAVDREIQVGSSNMVLLQTDASINPGNSGGALLNEYGQVIGVNSAKISSEDSEGLGFAIPSNTVGPIVEELIDKGYVSGRPLTGISGRNVSALTAAFYNIPQGILVDQVAPESDAAAKGLTAGDVIIGVDDIRVENISDACTLRDEHKAGDTMKLTFYRQGSTHEINIQLMEETNQQSEYDF
ncbi:S1C family serine protease [Intestinimonas sp. MSJ-38]|uniref:S1C family serine protease n=1 Tax=Intestinimonas sp. MSJ-38 TaxID=2841532 RepID=UPI001C0F4918|nr:trypsin-like peptidase domain-containing protein [Intestinimonas sp. MSJ-38]MBU5433324.1 trypsin-like peptidase domain-containing protein [Intestinimonas sp. MSJ-38]